MPNKYGKLSVGLNLYYLVSLHLFVTCFLSTESLINPLESKFTNWNLATNYMLTFIMGCFRSSCNTEKARVEKLPPRVEADDFDQ